VVGLAWDSIALRSLPAWLIEESVEKGLDWSEIYLETTAILAPTTTPQAKPPRKPVARAMGNKGQNHSLTAPSKIPRTK
jgi:hypothetical protein